MSHNTPANRPVRFLTGQQVYLRPLNNEDTEVYYQLLHDADMLRLTGTQQHFTREQIERYIDSKSQDSSSILLLIAETDTDEIVGDIALQDISSTNRSANLRIAISAARHQGRGYGSEAIRLLLDYGFGVQNLHRIELNVYAYNERAQHVYRKLGFQQEGIQRDAVFYNHQYHDAILMSMLEHEYSERYLNHTTA
ncbi:GNAT family N-acetyltransferase [Paenibacillus guangzhouensis]|uniref:GNAT family N-acetyltransferase n=1 Tax=Paenibacillus guangzhouensis TaxID=1473112 RepID=UPI00126750A2|nr:GNAT family protein [Paenibacillus guangzhouensis]